MPSKSFLWVLRVRRNSHQHRKCTASVASEANAGYLVDDRTSSACFSGVEVKPQPTMLDQFPEHAPA